MKAILTSVALLALVACGAPAKSYPVDASNARGALLGATFAKGVMPAWDSHYVRFIENYEGQLEVHMNSEEDLGGGGGYCGVAIKPTDESGAAVTVAFDCAGPLAGKTVTELEEITEAVLTNREPKFP